MMNTQGTRKRALNGVALVLGASLLLSACQSSKVKENDFVENVEPAETLYDQALNNMEAGSLNDAAKKLDELERQHPYSEYSRRSQILKTFISYRQGQYTEAVTSGQRYVSLYPGDKDAAYAQYLIGMSYFRQMPSVTRDQSVTARAYNAFNELVERYPESEYVEDAKTKMRIAYDQLAGKEMFIGRYYQERREFLAAIGRFRKVVEDFQTTRHVEEALARLVECYLSLGLIHEAQSAAAVLGANFPDSQWYKDALKQLQAAGAQPQENSGSWLSQIGQSLKPS